MGDAGEGLVDAEGRIQELMDERERARKTPARDARAKDPERARAVESWRLARTELARQLETTPSAARRQQIELALVELDRRIAEGAGAS